MSPRLGLLCFSMIAVWQSRGQMTEEASPWRAINDNGNQMREAGRCREAVRLLSRARSMAREKDGVRSEASATTANNLGAAYLCLGEYTRAERVFREGVESVDRNQSPETWGALTNNLGVLLLRLYRWKEAEAVLEEGRAVAEKVHGTNHSLTVAAVHGLGLLKLQTGDYQRARDLFRRVVTILEATAGNSVYLAAVLNNLGVAHLYLREFPDALALTSRALDLRRRLLPARHPDIGESLYNHAVALEKTGNRRQAQQAFREAGSIRSVFAAENLLGVTVDRKILEPRAQGKAMR